MVERPATSWILPAPAHFSLEAVVHSHGWVQIAPFTLGEGKPGFAYIDRLSSGRVVAWQVTENPEGVQLASPVSMEVAERAEVTAHATWMLGLEQDLEAFYALAALEPKLAHVPQQGRGRLLRSATLFEDVVKTILTTNTTWSGTLRMAAALVDRYGDPETHVSPQRSFPSPQRLAEVPVEELRSVTRLGYRAPYIQELAQSVASGQLDLEALKTSDLPTPELRKRLLAIKGVGGYAAANLLMLLGRYDEIPIDSWAFKLVSHEWYAGEPVGPAEVKAAFEAWGAYRGLAYWFWNWEYEF